MFPRLIWLAVGAFAIGTETLVISPLLPWIARDLDASIAAVGQLVTIFALGYALGSPVLSVLAGNIDRRRLLVACLAGFAVANLLAAAAQNLGQLAAARVLLALMAGLYMPTANAVASSLVPPEKRGRAIATVVAGLTVATAVGVPLGAWIGAHAHWRVTFVMVAAISAAAALALLIGLPRTLPRGAATLAQRVAVVRRPEVLHGLAVTLAFATGVFALFTYLAPLLARAAGLDAQGISATLFLFGVAAAGGNALGGFAADRFGPVPTVRTAFVALALNFALLALATTLPVPVAAIVIIGAVGLWGVIGWSLYAAQIANLVRLAPEVAMVSLSLNASTFYLGVAAGAVLGSLALSAGSIAAIAWIASIAQLVGLAILQIGPRLAPAPVLQPGE